MSIRINATNNPFSSPKGQLPVFRSNNNTLCDADQILEFLNEKKCDLDSKLFSKESAEILAFKSYLDESIRPAINYLWFYNFY